MYDLEVVSNYCHCLKPRGFVALSELGTIENSDPLSTQTLIKLSVARTQLIK